MASWRRGSAWDGAAATTAAAAAAAGGTTTPSCEVLRAIGAGRHACASGMASEGWRGKEDVSMRRALRAVLFPNYGPETAVPFVSTTLLWGLEPRWTEVPGTPCAPAALNLCSQANKEATGQSGRPAEDGVTRGTHDECLGDTQRTCIRRCVSLSYVRTLLQGAGVSKQKAAALLCGASKGESTPCRKALCNPQGGTADCFCACAALSPGARRSTALSHWSRCGETWGVLPCTTLSHTRMRTFVQDRLTSFAVLSLAAIPMMVNLAEILKGNRWAVETSEPRRPWLMHAVVPAHACLC